MTALRTSLALSIWPRGRRILLTVAVNKCMKEQYWKVDNSPRITYIESKKDKI